jgi:FMN phosphatase YigB (HAD superfamily)
VSNVPRDLRPIFAAHDLADLVDAFTHSFEVGAEKPDPAIFLRACEALGTKPSETLMVGDHPVADAGSLAAGLRFHLLAPDGAADRPRGLDAVVGIVERSLDRATTRTGRDVAVFVYRGGRLLLMKRARQGIWHIPSGVVETAESFVEAAGRELEEETGLRSASGLIDLSLPQRYPVTDDERHEYPSDVKEVTLHNFAIAAPRRWEPTLNEEHSEYRWSSFADALALLHWPDTREVLKELVRRLAVVTDQRA